MGKKENQKRYPHRRNEDYEEKLPGVPPKSIAKEFGLLRPTFIKPKNQWNLLNLTIRKQEAQEYSFASRFMFHEPSEGGLAKMTSSLSNNCTMNASQNERQN
jgi:hypothetical protein